MAASAACSGIAFHPGYPTDPRVFVDYTDTDGNTVVSSFRVSASDPDAAPIPDSEVVLLQVTQPFANHNGGGIHFGPDGKLYIALGDGGSAGDPQGNGQRLDTLLAKILRIDVDGTSGARRLRDPARQPVPRDRGRQARDLADRAAQPVALQLRPRDRRPVDRRRRPGRRGRRSMSPGAASAAWTSVGTSWRGSIASSRAAAATRPGLTLPVAEYGHDLGCAVIGGVVVRDPRQGRLDGGYLFGDACSDNLWLMDPTGDGRREPVLVERMGRSLSSIDAIDDGTVYATAPRIGRAAADLGARRLTDPVRRSGRSP